uniref:histidine phosphatase family protein n=1 Tax=Nocardia farcinica TaxID=37329 RepID=UPI0024581A4F
MSADQHRLILLRHGETEWSAAGRHTGRTELELTAAGREQARSVASVLSGVGVRDPLVVSSPRRRAVETAELAGLAIAEVSELLAEWDYGAYEGLTTPRIRESVPDWLVWTHGCPGGESVGAGGARAPPPRGRGVGGVGARGVGVGGARAIYRPGEG